MPGERTQRCLARRVDRLEPATVTVIVPCFNYGRYLEDAVNSALDQRGVEVQVIIVDDASTDDSVVVAERLARADRRVTVVRHLENAGPVTTFNDGISIAEGEYLVRLDADDLLTPGCLARAVAVGTRFPEVGLVYGHPVHFASADIPRLRQHAVTWTIWPGRRWLSQRCVTGRNVITAPEVVMRTSVVDHVGGQRQLAHSHDFEMWMRMAAFCDVAHIEGADQALHRVHPESLSSTVDHLADLLHRRDAFDVLFSGPVGDIPRAEVMWRSAHRALAREALASANHEYDRGRGGAPMVEDLIGFARETYEDMAKLSGHRALRRRQRYGAELCARLPGSILSALGRRLRSEFVVRRWALFGN